MKRVALVVLSSLIIAAPAMAYDNVYPVDAYYETINEADTYILDVRTSSEWDWVGHPGVNKSGEGADLTGKVINIPYQIEYKGTTMVNPSFLADVKKVFPDPEAVTLITMCRSGGRSVSAAIVLEDAGYTSVANMLTGFEGGTDANGYRTRNGWKVDGLPYNYSRGSYHDGHHGNGKGYGLDK